MSVVERWRPSIESWDARVEYTGAIASTPGTVAELVELGERERHARDRGIRTHLLRGRPVDARPHRAEQHRGEHGDRDADHHCEHRDEAGAGVAQRPRRPEERHESRPCGRGADEACEGERVQVQHHDARHEREEQRHGRQQRVDSRLRGRRGQPATEEQHDRGGGEQHDDELRDPAEATATRAAQVGAGTPERAERGGRGDHEGGRGQRERRGEEPAARAGVGGDDERAQHAADDRRGHADRESLEGEDAAELADGRPSRRRELEAETPSLEHDARAQHEHGDHDPDRPGGDRREHGVGGRGGRGRVGELLAEPAQESDLADRGHELEPLARAERVHVARELAELRAQRLRLVGGDPLGEHREPRLHGHRQVDRGERGPRGGVDERRGGVLGRGEPVVDHRWLERARHVGPDPVGGIDRREGAGEAQGLVDAPDAHEPNLAELPRHALGHHVGEEEVDRDVGVESAVDRSRPVARRQLDVLAQARVEARQHPIDGGAGGGSGHHRAHGAHDERRERCAGDAAQGLWQVVADAGEQLLLAPPHGVDVVGEGGARGGGAVVGVRPRLRGQVQLVRGHRRRAGPRGRRYAGRRRPAAPTSRGTR